MARFGRAYPVPHRRQQIIYFVPPTSQIKSTSGVVRAGIKSISGLAIASVKKTAGVINS